MSDLLPFIIIGLTSGAVYGLAGVGLVLTYKTSGVFNFAHGALATASAYVFYELHGRHGVAWPVAAAVAVLVVGPLLGLLLEYLARAIQGARLTLRVAATIGLLLVIEAGIELIYGTEQVRNVAPFLADGHVRIAGTNVEWADLITFGFALTVTAILSVVFRRTRHGLAMRAVVDDPALLDITGISPARTRRLAWMIGVALASASGVLFAPLLPLDPVQLTLLVVAAFGAAAIGAFTNLPATFAGGLGIGVLAACCTKWFSTGLLAGLPPSLPFVVLFVVLLVFPRRYLAGPAFSVPRVRPAWRAPAAVQLVGAAILLVALLAVPAFAGSHLTDWTTAVATMVVFLSLGLLVRTSGQVSLGHVAFTAIGAAAFSHLSTDAGLPWLLAILGAGLVAVPVGALLAIPAIRLTGLYLALATFGFGVLLQGMFYTQDYMFGSNATSLAMPRPSLALLTLDSDTGFYYVTVAVALAATALVVALGRGRLGRLLRGIAESPTSLETSGAAVNVTRVLVFCLSAFLAAVAGAFIGMGQGTVSAESYPPLLSLSYFALIVMVGGGPAWAAATAAAALVLVPSYVGGDQTTVVLQLLFGLGALLTAVVPEDRRGVPSAVRDRLDVLRLRRRRPSAAVAEPVAPPPAAAGRLEVTGLRVAFGGLVAVDGVSITAPGGTITGLIGPNGAGKTTTFNACCGLVRPRDGRVALAGRDVSRRGPSARARAGLGRTFQMMQLCETLSVRENVAVGAEAGLAGGSPLRHVLGRRGDAAAVASATVHAMQLCDLADVADRPVLALSTGQRRLVEIARCLAGRFDVLLLDEPSSGLDRAETARFGEILVRAVRERGIGVLLVEHDMSLVLDTCTNIYVLDFGRLIFAGSSAEVTASPLVRAAYLGDEPVEGDAQVHA